MTKTPEQLAEEYVDKNSGGECSDDTGGLRAAFLAGYQAAKPQWISVKERLPEIAPNRFVSDDVLWISRYGELHVSCLEQLRHEIRVDWGEAGLLKLDQVTHWMPLPNPPEDK